MSDEHAGVSEAGGVPYTYEHVDEEPQPDFDVYRVTCVLEAVDRPTQKNTYYVPSDRLDSFFDSYSQSGERVVDIDPMDGEEATRELDGFLNE